MTTGNGLLKKVATAAVVAVVAALAACSQGDKSSSEMAALTDKVARLEAQMADANDRRQIKDLYVRFFRGVDRHDMELIDSVFWPDARLSWGPGSYRGDEVAKVIIDTDKTENMPKGLAGTTHSLANQTVDITGDVAHVESYLMATFRYRDDKPATIIGGRYIDRVDRRNGEWRIAVREFIPDYVIEAKSNLESSLTKWKWSPSPCASGTWDRRDPSYLRPLLPRKEGEKAAACAE